MIVYSPKILTSLKQIRETFGVSVDTVREWAKDGAPIVVEGSSNGARYSAEVAALQEWRLERIFTENRNS